MLPDHGSPASLRTLSVPSDPTALSTHHQTYDKLTFKILSTLLLAREYPDWHRKPRLTLYMLQRWTMRSFAFLSIRPTALMNGH